MPEDPRKTRERIETLLRKALTLTQKLPQSESVQEAAAPYDPASSHYRVARYPYSRFYALYDGDQLLAVTVYKKGAEAVRERLQAQEARIAALTQALHSQGEVSPAAQFLAVCSRLKWSRHLTKSPCLALLAMAGSSAAYNIISACSNAVS